MVSNRLAAARFARAFGAKVSTEEARVKAGYGEEHRRVDKDSGRSSSKEGERSAVPQRLWRGRPGSPRREGLLGFRRGRG